MRISVASGNIGAMADPDVSRRLAQLAEELGFSTWWTLDNLASPSPQPDGSPMDPQLPVVDSFVHLAFIAACTQRINLGTAVIALPTRPALLTAKQVASLAYLSNDRVRLGVGIGYLEPELKAAGVAFNERGARTDEYLQAMRAVWSTDPVEYEGRYVSIHGVASRPQPARSPYIAVGGHADRALRRAVRHGNAWIGGEGPAGPEGAIAKINELVAQGNRPTELGRLEVINMVDKLDNERFERYRQLGVDETVVMFEHTSSEGAAASLLHECASLVSAGQIRR
ncbi:TIGR03619 family F420-dependent LLM class oxidoreductase [Mycobacteroides chelonae]|uniref:TIGR03619 family F420-dependent LLM class oxidoreductase n=1 Tax=Mycobacteroides chelonae TaxID=1774 RepID=UPI0009BEAF98|nr:TIGR03619 family F420-dependent LLM class oxidoreductase [Mycobacteroides chelonae]